MAPRPPQPSVCELIPRTWYWELDDVRSRLGYCRPETRLSANGKGDDGKFPVRRARVGRFLDINSRRGTPPKRVLTWGTCRAFALAPAQVTDGKLLDQEVGKLWTETGATGQWDWRCELVELTNPSYIGQG